MHRNVLLIGLNIGILIGGIWLGWTDLPQSDSYPNKPIQLIVPFGAGGGTDTYSRIIKKSLVDNQLLPQPLVIVNIDGAGATIGSRRAKDAEADGYTLLILHDAILTAKYSGTVDYGPESFEPVAGTGEVGMVITVTENSPYRNLQELLKAAKEKPETIPFGANLGAMTHFAGLQLEKASPDAKFRYIQIGGGAKRFADLKGGHIALTGFSIEEFVRFRSANLRGLAYFGKERHAAAPDVPTAIEQGFDVTSSNTFYWWFPKGTPQKCIDVIADALEKAMRTAYVQEKMAEIHCQPIFVRGEELQNRIEESTRRIAAVDKPRSTDLPDYPLMILTGIACVSVAVGVQSVRQRFREARVLETDSEGPAIVPQTKLAALTVAIVVLYVLILSWSWLDFRVATIPFICVVGMALTHFQLKRFPELLLIAQTIGFSLHFLFSEVFVIDLP